MKKAVALLLAVLLTAAISGCSDSSGVEYLDDYIGDGEYALFVRFDITETLANGEVISYANLLGFYKSGTVISLSSTTRDDDPIVSILDMVSEHRVVNERSRNVSRGKYKLRDGELVYSFNKINYSGSLDSSGNLLVNRLDRAAEEPEPRVYVYIGSVRSGIVSLSEAFLD